jgi:hypothetical protein
MQNIGIGGVNPMASLGTNPGSLGTMGTMQNAMTGVSTADPLAQTYSSLSPYTASFNNPYSSFMLQSPTRQQQKEGICNLSCLVWNEILNRLNALITANFCCLEFFKDLKVQIFLSTICLKNSKMPTYLQHSVRLEQWSVLKYSLIKSLV